MISVEEALERLLSQVEVLGREEVPILDALGQVLAEDVRSDINVPPLDNAAMDGYAVQARDTAGATPSAPRILRVIGTVAAGSPPDLEVTRGTAIRIMTGAAIPRGADSVVKFEDTDEAQRQEKEIKEIGICAEARVGDNVRCAGEDIAAGSLVLAAGTLLRPAHIGLLASVGRCRVSVIARPVVAIIATGDELAEVGEKLPYGKIYNSNSYSVAALARRYGAIPRMLGIARDNKASLAEAIKAGLDADMLITTGGVSMGDYDVVKDILAEQGEIGFWTVRMKPGKPIAFGTIKGVDGSGTLRTITHLGLPGNPVSSMVTFEVFARPAILKMMGRKDLEKPTIEAVLQDRVINKDGRRVFTRVIVQRGEKGYEARITGPQGSGILTSMGLANGLAIIPEDEKEALPGTTVKVMMLDWDDPLMSSA